MGVGAKYKHKYTSL